MSGGYEAGGRFRQCDRALRRAHLSELRRIQLRNRAASAASAGIDPVLEAREGRLPPLGRIFTPGRLFDLYRFCERHRGYAAGIDKLTWGHLSHADVRRLCDQLPAVVIDRAYRPRGYRKVEILKRDGTCRTLKLRVILDRLVATTANEVLSAYFEGRFDDSSYGYRERRSHWHVIASVERHVRAGYYVLAQDDIRGAFDHVRVSHVMPVLARHGLSDGWLWLVERILRGDDDGHDLGIDQGSALSPLMLNVLLDDVLDRPLGRLCLEREHAARGAAPVRGVREGRRPAAPPSSPLVRHRFADNLVEQARTKIDGRWALETAADLLRPYGLGLKGVENGLVDLREHWTELLGFKIWAKDGALSVSPGPEAWRDLEDGLREAHDTRDPYACATDMVRGWIQALGPALGQRQERFASKLHHVIRGAGFNLPLPTDVTLGLMGVARDRYLKLLERGERTAPYPGEPSGDSAGEEATTLSCLPGDGDMPFLPTSPPLRRANLGDGREAACGSTR